MNSFVDQRNRPLAHIAKIARAELIQQARRVCGFEETRTEASMDFDGRAQDLVSYRIEISVDQHARRESKPRALLKMMVFQRKRASITRIVQCCTDDKYEVLALCRPAGLRPAPGTSNARIKCSEQSR